jgi:hypothetical protein
MSVTYIVRRIPELEKVNSVSTILCNRDMPLDQDEFEIKQHELNCMLRYGNVELVSSKTALSSGSDSESYSDSDSDSVEEEEVNN